MGAGCLAAHAEEPAARCFRMAMVDDGKSVEAPARVTFIDGSEREEVEAREKRYCVPESMTGAATLDLTFESSGSRFDLFHVRMDLLSAEWDVAFGSKRYARDEKIAKSINVEESCTLHIRVGEDEKDMTVSGCRHAVGHQR